MVLGTFNTSFGDNGGFGKVPLPDDYKGSVAETMINYLKSGKVPVNGDKNKAMKAVFDVVTGQGVGAGHEAEPLLPLGPDMIPRVQGVRDHFAHTLEVFGSVAESVAIDK